MANIVVVGEGVAEDLRSATRRYHGWYLAFIESYGLRLLRLYIEEVAHETSHSLLDTTKHARTGPKIACG
jgi:hypothetical protein